MKAILSEQAELRLDTLRKLFQIDRYQRIRENSQVLHKELRQRQALLKGQILDIDEKERLLSKALDDIKTKDEAVASLMPRIERLTSDVIAKRKEIKAKEGEIREYSQLKAEYAALKAGQAEKQSSADRTLAEIQSNQRQIGLLELRISEMKLGEPAKAQASEDELEVLEKRRDSLQSQIAELEGEIRAQQRLRDDLKKVEDSIASLKRCPLCLQDVSPSHIAHIRKDQDEKIAEADKAISGHRAKLEQLAIDRKVQEERLARLKLEARQEVEHRLRLKERENLHNLLMEKQSVKLQLEAKQAELKAEIVSLAEKKIIREAELEQKKQLDVEQNALKTELESLEKAERAILIESTKLRSELDSLTRNKAVLEDEVNRKRKARDELRLLVQKQNWLQLVFTELMLQMERAVMMRVYNEFNEIFQQFFSMLLEDANLSVNLTEDFSPAIEQAGYDISYDDLSGGEKTSIALAYRLALNRVVNDLIDNIKTDDLIILDEPTDGFSSDQLDKLRAVLDVLGTRQTIIVSHEQKIESFVQNVIRVGKREHTSVIG
jgi:exonuclease SbcC